ncbi:MAG: DsbA family protein [Candidatus Bipolaricaulia bacterium]
MGKQQKKKQQSSNQSERQQKQTDRDAQMQKITSYTGIVVVALVVAFIGIYVFSNQNSTGGGSENVPLSIDGQPTLGPSDAPVEVIEFGDFMCPACKAFHERVYPQLKSNYVDTGQIQFAFLNFPLPIGEGSWTAADGAECVYHQAGNKAFWGYYNGVYTNQGPESESWVTTDLLVQLAQDYTETEIDTDGLRQCINNQEYRDEVERDRSMGRTANIPGTPAIFVNGRQMSDFSYSTISSAIDEELGSGSE